MTSRRGFLSWARELDNRALGRPDSKRGWFLDLLMGLNPVLARVWFALAGVLLVVGGVQAFRGADWVTPTFRAGWLLLLGYAGRSLPRRWRRTRDQREPDEPVSSPVA
ncbi:MAG: hypothetical protein WCD35_05195 [Mycobacteriales bacterium]